MNEMISVKTKGNWVTTMVKISAGSSGARRAQSAERRSAPLGGGEGGGGGGGVGGSCPRPRLVSRVVLIPLPSPSVVLPARSSGFPLLIALRDVLSELLPPLECLLDGHPAGDRGTD